MKLEDSSTEKWECREHTKVKHILLEKYLKVWITILGSGNPAICYVDGFAGRGEYADGTLGSPLIALKVADSKRDYFSRMICVFVEKDPENYKNLEIILEREKANIRIYDEIKFVMGNNEFKEVIDIIFDILEEEEKDPSIPSFFFIDPFGFSGVPFTGITRILKNPKTEIFFNFMVRDTARFLTLPPLEETYNNLFGTDKWKEIIKSSKNRELDLINLYRRQLHEVAGIKYSWPFRVCPSERTQTLYYLIHVTNNFKGHSIMKSIMYNQSTEGNFAYLGPDEITASSQIKLFSINNIQDLKNYLLERFTGQKLNYDEIQEQVCEPWYTEPPYVDKHYREALKSLEKKGKIKVKRITSKTERGLSGKDIIEFVISNPLTLSSYKPSILKPKVHYKEYLLLNGSRQILSEKVNDGSIITRFDKTPLPTKETDVICPHFLELKWAYGCPYDCAWCYLKGTFRFHPNKTAPVIKDYQKIELHTKTFLEECKIPEILNTGEIADSLMGENLTKPFSKFIIPFFEAQKRHKVLFLTKSPNIKNLLELPSHKQVIIGFSLNAAPVAEKWEKAPPMMKRLDAAGKLYQNEYEVRLRIDPLVPLENWKKHYLSLIDCIFEKMVPERITLGSLRGLQTTINGATDKTWVKYLTEGSGWGKKININLRYKMYAEILDYLETKYNYKKISLCKETLEMWEKLQLNYKKIKCNCIW